MKPNEVSHDSDYGPAGPNPFNLAVVFLPSVVVSYEAERIFHLSYIVRPCLIGVSQIVVPF